MFNKEEYWKNRKAGKRGQVNKIIEPNLAKDEDGNDRVSDVYLVDVPDKKVKSGKRIMAINRQERRRMIKRK